MIHHLDLETRSCLDIRKYGAARYAWDPSTEILLCAVARGDEPVLLWDCEENEFENNAALELLQQISKDPDAVVYCHNAQFEILVIHRLWEKTFGFPPPALEQFRCTAVLCRAAAIPQSLGDAAEFLKLNVQKDTMGKALIQKFCVPQKVRGRNATYWIDKRWPKMFTAGGQKMDADEAWSLFREYCIKDVEVERQLHKRLSSLELKGWLLDMWKLDIRLNLRGVPINIDAVDHALTLIEEYTEKITEEFVSITGFNPTQGKVFLPWLKERGYPGEDLTLAVVTWVLTGTSVDEATGITEGNGVPNTDGMTAEAVQALKLKSMIGYAALKKLPTMKGAVCDDNRVRGMFKFWGAIRTGRYSSSVVQLQNLKRPSHDSEDVFRLVRGGGISPEHLEILYGSPLEALASGIRHYIGYPDGQQIMGADYSQIEARVLPWLCGHTELLEAFKRGEDLYKVTGAMAFGKKIEEITKDERQTAKAMVLACGYAGGLAAMDAACKMYGIEMTDKEKRRLVKAWRKSNKPIVDFWKLLGDTAVEAIQNPGKWFVANEKVKFGVTRQLGYPCLVMEGPSGRKLCYPHPEVKEAFKIKRLRRGVVLDELEDPDEAYEWVDIPRFQAVGADGELFKGVWATWDISYFGPGKQSVVWGRTRTHAGVFAENLTQQTAGDFLCHGALEAEKAGYEQILTVHDEIAAEFHPGKGQSAEGLVEAMCKLPPWAKDFPLAAVGEVVDFYTK